MLDRKIRIDADGDISAHRCERLSISHSDFQIPLRVTLTTQLRHEVQIVDAGVIIWKSIHCCLLSCEMHPSVFDQSLFLDAKFLQSVGDI
jgi:hypothetical protein